MKTLLALLAVSVLFLAVGIVRLNWVTILFSTVAIIGWIDMLWHNAAFRRVLAEMHEEGRK